MTLPIPSMDIHGKGIFTYMDAINIVISFGLRLKPSFWGSMVGSFLCVFFERLIVFFSRHRSDLTGLINMMRMRMFLFLCVFESSKRTRCCEFLIRFRVKKKALNCNTCLNQKSN